MSKVQAYSTGHRCESCGVLPALRDGVWDSQQQLLLCVCVAASWACASMRRVASWSAGRVGLRLGVLRRPVHRRTCCMVVCLVWFKSTGAGGAGRVYCIHFCVSGGFQHLWTDCVQQGGCFWHWQQPVQQTSQFADFLCTNMDALLEALRLFRHSMLSCLRMTMPALLLCSCR